MTICREQQKLCLDTCAWTPCLQICSWELCLVTSLGNPFLETCSWKPVLGNSLETIGNLFRRTMPGNLSWEHVLENYLGNLLGNLLLRTLLGNLFLGTCSTNLWEPLGILGTCSWEPSETCLGTLLGGLAWTLLGGLAWEPCLRTF